MKIWMIKTLIKTLNVKDEKKTFFYLIKKKNFFLLQSLYLIHSIDNL
jgi:hypothetical protein